MENKNNIIPIFKTDASINRSLFIVDDTLDIKENAPISIFALAKKHNINKLIVIDDSFVNFPSLYKRCAKYGIQLIFGVNFRICNDITIKTEESLLSNCKISVLLKNGEGYQDLVKLHNAINSNAESFYYTTRGSWKILVDNWTDNLELVFPSYDNFLHKNLLENGNCVPNFGKIKPTLFYSNQDLPFDNLLQDKIIQYGKNNKFELSEVYNCFYYKNEDFKSYCVLRTVGERSKFNNPNIDFLCSNQFSFESYLNKIGGKI